MIAQFSVIPLGSGISLGEKVAEVIKVVDESGLAYQATAMGTIVEGSWDDVMKIIKKCRDTAMQKSDRVVITISIDERADGLPDRLEGKIKSVERRLGKIIKK